MQALFENPVYTKLFINFISIFILNLFCWIFVNKKIKAAYSLYAALYALVVLILGYVIRLVTDSVSLLIKTNFDGFSGLTKQIIESFGMITFLLLLPVSFALIYLQWYYLPRLVLMRVVSKQFSFKQVSSVVKLTFEALILMIVAGFVLGLLFSTWNTFESLPLPVMLNK